MFSRLSSTFSRRNIHSGGDGSILRSIEDFPIFTWHALQHRRIFLLPILCTLTSFFWILAINIWISFENFSTSSTGSAICLSIIGLYLLLFSIWRRLISRYNVERPISFILAISLILISLALLYGNDLSGSDDYKFTKDRGLASSIIAGISLVIFHHVGLSNSALWIIVSSLICIWMHHLIYSSSSILIICVYIITVIILLLNGIIQNFEYKQLFSKVKDTISSNFNEQPLVESISDVVTELEFVLSQLQIHLNSYNIEIYKENEDGSMRWMKLGALIESCRYLSLSISSAISLSGYELNNNFHHITTTTPTTNINNSNINTINSKIEIDHIEIKSLQEICNKVYALVETISGCSLPLLESIPNQEATIAAPAGILELILFLLIYEATAKSVVTICRLDCVYDDKNENWILTLYQVNGSICTSNNNNHNDINNSSSNVVRGGFNTNKIAVSSPTTNDEISFDKNDKVEVEDEMGYVFSLENNNNNNNSSSNNNNEYFLHLAQHIAKKHLNTSIECSIKNNVEVKTGLQHCSWSLRLEGTKPIDRVIRNEYHHHHNHHNLSSMSMIDTPKVIQQWLFIEHNYGDMNCFSQVKDHLITLEMTINTCSAHRLNKLTTVSQVIIVHEALIKKHYRIIMSDINDAAIAVVVLCESDKSIANLLEDYGMDFAFYLSFNPSLIDVYRLILEVSASLPPRSVSKYHQHLSNNTNNNTIKRFISSKKTSRSSDISTIYTPSVSSPSSFSSFSKDVDNIIRSKWTESLVEFSRLSQLFLTSKYLIEFKKESILEINQTIKKCINEIKDYTNEPNKISEEFKLNNDDNNNIENNGVSHYLDPKKRIAKFILELFIQPLKDLKNSIKMKNDTNIRDIFQIFVTIENESHSKSCYNFGRLNVFLKVLVDILNLYIKFNHDATNVTGVTNTKSNANTGQHENTKGNTGQDTTRDDDRDADTDTASNLSNLVSDGNTASRGEEDRDRNTNTNTTNSNSANSITTINNNNNNNDNNNNNNKTITNTNTTTNTTTNNNTTSATTTTTTTSDNIQPADTFGRLVETVIWFIDAFEISVWDAVRS